MAKAATPIELSLVVICSVWPRTPAQLADIRGIAVSNIDWHRATRIATRHGVSGFVADALRQTDIMVPDILLRAARRCAIGALRQAGEALRLQRCFVEQNIPLLFLKGTSLAGRLYGQIGIRDAVDMDLAVPLEHLEQAWRVLVGAGYHQIIPRQALPPAASRMFVWAAKDSFHRHVDHGLVVELHWRLSDDLPDPRIPPVQGWQQVALPSGDALATLSDDELFVYLCTHGAAHLWARLKWLVDVGAMIAASADGGARYWARAQDVGAKRAAASAFLMLHELMDVPLPENFSASRSWRVLLLNRLARRAIEAGGGERDLAGTRYRGWAELMAKLLIAPGAAARWAVIRRILISAEDIGLLGLPLALSFLYPFVRIPLLIARRWRRAPIATQSR